MCWNAAGSMFICNGGFHSDSNTGEMQTALVLIIVSLLLPLSMFTFLPLQRSRIAVDEAPAGFANLRVINAGVCPIKAFGVGLNTEVPLMEVRKEKNMSTCR